MRLLFTVVLLRDRVAARLERDEVGMTTAELLGNAALAIVALVAIWAALQALGLNIVSWIGQKIGVG
jgi:hypothetical protein